MNTRHLLTESRHSSEAIALCWTPKYPEKFAAMPEAWRELIARGKEIQKNLAIGDDAFTGALLTGSSWNLMTNGNYPVPKAPKALNRITSTLWALLEQGKETLVRRAEKKKDPLTLAERFVNRPEYEEVKDCLEDAQANAEEAMEERVVILVGGTRAGKTAMLAKLKAERKVNWHLSATPDLRSSYKAFLAGIARALSLRDIEGSSSSEIQRSIMSKLEKMRGVLAIEELQSFSPKALEFLKGLLNHTQVCLVICMLPGQFARMTRSTGEDMQQFLGRSVGVVKLAVTPSLVASFAPQLWARCPQAAELQERLATEAMMGGGMSLLRDVCRDASLLSKSEGLKPHHITDALADFRRKIPAMGQVKALRVA